MSTKITLYRGVNYPSTYKHTTTVNGTVISLPLTGCTVFFTIKTKEYDDDPTDASAIYKVTVTSHTDAVNGITNWDTLIPAVGITPGKYFFDIIVKGSDGKALPPALIGDCVIKGKTTNRNS